MPVETDAAWSGTRVREAPLVERSPLLLATVVAVAYFLAAGLSLGLVARPQDVAVFWPAAGIATGSMLAVPPSTRPWLAAGVLVATVAVNLLSGNGIAMSLAFAVVNAGEGWLVAELVQRRFGFPFRLDRLHRVTGLLVTSAASAAVAGVAGAVALHLVDTSSARIFDVAVLFLAADFVGIVTVAPLVLALATSGRSAPVGRRAIVEGVVLLGGLTLAAGYFLGLPPGEAPLPLAGALAALFPLLLMLAVRSPPVLALAAPAVIALATVWHTVHGLGPFADPAHGLGERVMAAQLFMTAAALCSLTLFALVAQRRRAETELRGSEARLRAALDLAGLSPYTWDPSTGALDWEPALKRLWGLPADARVDHATFLAGVHPDDRAMVAANLARSLDPSGDRTFKAEFRVVGANTEPIERWVSARGQTLFAAGRAVGFVGVALDVTERKAAEESLRQSEARLRLALEAGQMGVWHAEVATQKTWWDEAQCRIYGVEQKSFKPSDEHFFALVHPDDRDRLRAESAVAVASGRSFDGEFRIVRADTGETRWVAVRYALARDSTGKPLEVTGVTWDITARRRAEERLRFVLKAASVGAWSVDLATGRADCSEECRRNFGVAPEEDFSTYGHVLQRIHPEDRGAQEAAVSAAIASGVDYEAEYRVLWPDGTLRWILARGQVVRRADGPATAIAGITVDITDRKRVEDKLRASEESARRQAQELDALYRTMPVGLVLLDRELRYLRCNETLAEMNGLPAEAHLGRTVREIVPDLADRLEPRLRSVLDEGKPQLGLEIEGETARQPGVRRVWIEDLHPLRAADGGVVAVSVVVHEVTERKRWEERQRLLLRELDHRAKNLLAVVQSVARQTARSAESVAGLDEALSGRLRAMAAAHDALAASGWGGAELAEVARAILSPYLAVDDGRLRLELPRLLLAPSVAQSLNLALHELATNAAKYGALSRPNGRVTLLGSIESDELRLTWSEEGGPEVVAPPSREGFGSVLIARALAQQTGGQVERDWRPHGLVCRITLPLRGLAAEDGRSPAPPA